MSQGVLTVPQPFSLELTLLCGQCFRWQRSPEWPKGFQGAAGHVFWRVRQEGDRLYWECSADQVRGEDPAVWLGRYLGFEDDLAAWVHEYSGNNVLAPPLKTLRGLRLMRQEPWECTVSYMFAQGLSVKVIRHAIAKFCERFGKPIAGAPGIYAFPEPADIAHLSPDLMRAFTNNYRARADRIIRLARVVEAQVVLLDHFKNIPCDDAREALVALDGIGPKIADCILLFSMDHLSAFPVDRWVLRAMKRYYKVRWLGAKQEAPTRVQYVKVVQKARKLLGGRCGVASEYLFLYLRLLEDAKLREELGPHCEAWEDLMARVPEKRPRPRKKK